MPGFWYPAFNKVSGFFHISELALSYVKQALNNFTWCFPRYTINDSF